MKSDFTKKIRISRRIYMTENKSPTLAASHTSSLNYGILRNIEKERNKEGEEESVIIIIRLRFDS